MKKLTLTLVLFLSVFVFAKDSNTMSKKTYDVLMKAQKFMEEDKYKEAKKLLLPLTKSAKNAYGKSYVLQTLANISINNDNYKQASKYYEEIIKLNSFEEKSIEKIKFSLAKIYLSMNKYKKSIKILNTLFEKNIIAKTEIYENLAYAYYYDKKYKQTIKNTKSLLKVTQERKESWYQILYSSYVELKQYKNGINTLKYMVKRWHKNETYWLQLIALYQETNQLKKALSTFELAYKKNGINPEKNAMYFVNILLQNQLYHKAAIQIKIGLNKGYIEDNKKNFELLVSCLDYAKQKNEVIDILSTSKHAKTVKYQLLLGNIYYNKEQYKKSINVLKDIKIKRGSKKDGQRNTLLALSYYELNNKKETKKYLRKAINNPHEKRRALNIKKSLQI